MRRQRCSRNPVKPKTAKRRCKSRDWLQAQLSKRPALLALRNLLVRMGLYVRRWNKRIAEGKLAFTRAQLQRSTTSSKST